MPTAANYALLDEALIAFEAVKKPLITAQVALSPDNKFRNTRENAATLDCFTYLPQLPRRTNLR
ncbi:hypothetical protein [Nostoc sp. GT001]|uniref:hypothetical protein n=1 Tax=Nostoc sp. GT001 TaxID=3056647 RepID=UPI0025AAE98C|nr:hypothetical protein [Nostoc sp. GT001]MDM9582943.1 hypothetical protein [Nostoc sp. GT001]